MIAALPSGSVAYIAVMPPAQSQYKYRYNDLLNRDYMNVMDVIDKRYDAIESEIESLGKVEPIPPWYVK